jgi:23S rRNA (uracil1939-C5)-methyltransferase
LNSEDRVLDLFSGLGNLSLPIAQKAKSVCAIEGVEAMVKRSRYNAMKNNITNFTSSNANLIQSLQPHAWFQENYTKIVLDPPRDGAAEIIDAIATKRPSHIVYVSCNPATLARDAGELVRHGYRLAKVGVMDMFTQTTHIESIAQFVL